MLMSRLGPIRKYFNKFWDLPPLKFARHFPPAAESHGLWPWMNAPALGRDVVPLGRSLGGTGFARGAPLPDASPLFGGEARVSVFY